MKKVHFNVGCLAIYPSSIVIPDEIENDYKAILTYIQEHLTECNVEGDIKWIQDLEPENAVTIDDIGQIEDYTTNVLQVRAYDINWDSEEEDLKNLPKSIILPDDYNNMLYDELVDKVSDYLSDTYSFCHDGYMLIQITEKDLEEEELALKQTIIGLPTAEIEEFLGHEITPDTNISSEVNYPSLK